MHRVRQSLPYFEAYGFAPTVLSVMPDYVEMAQDLVLEKSIPKDIPIYKVTAFSTTYTRKLGLGNLGLRAFNQLYKKGNDILKVGNFDLIYFSTTVFATLPLGRLWKKKHKIPFIIDMQDPWRNDYYLTLPKEKRPPKFWFAHRLNSFLEKMTIPSVDGIISVSPAYIDILKQRYPSTINVPSKILTFGAHRPDLQVAANLSSDDLSYKFDNTKTNIIYAGVVPPNMLYAIEAIMMAIKNGLRENPRFNDIQLHFIGTNYATDKRIKSSLKELIKKYSLENTVFEKEERIPYFEVLKLVQDSNLAIIPGTLDSDYTASKLYPYIMANVPLIAVFHENSTVLSILKEVRYGEGIQFNDEVSVETLSEKIYESLSVFLTEGQSNEDFRNDIFKHFESDYLTSQQVQFFNEVLGI